MRHVRSQFLEAAFGRLGLAVRGCAVPGGTAARASRPRLLAADGGGEGVTAAVLCREDLTDSTCALGRRLGQPRSGGLLGGGRPDAPTT
jgi:hypothetical protein